MKTILLDSSAFIAGLDISKGEAEIFTVPSIVNEVIKDSLLKLRIQVAINSGKLLIKTPESKYVTEVDEALKRLGESGFLSTPDRDLLALSLQFKEEGRDPIIFSDDYSIQNIAEHFCIRYGSTSTLGIKKRFSWVIYCPGCKKTFDAVEKGSSCPICGTILKRKPLKKSIIKSKFK